MAKIIKVRANKVSIETPKEGSEPWIRLEVQRVEKDEENGIYNVTDRWDSFNMRLSQVATDEYPLLFDPSSGSVNVNSIAIQLTYLFADWLAKKYNGTLDPSTLDVFIEE